MSYVIATIGGLFDDPAFGPLAMDPSWIPPGALVPPGVVVAPVPGAAPAPSPAPAPSSSRGELAAAVVVGVVFGAALVLAWR